MVKRKKKFYIFKFPFYRKKKGDFPFVRLVKCLMIGMSMDIDRRVTRLLYRNARPAQTDTGAIPPRRDLGKG